MAGVADVSREPAEPVVRLVASHELRGPLAALVRVLRDARDALGERVRDDGLPAGWQRYLVDMRMPIGDGRRLSFRKAAYVDIAPVRIGPGGTLTADICWRAASLQPLFPVFAGRLTASRGELRLDGWYAPPGGGLGVLADRLLLHVAASGTARWLLGAIAGATAGEPPG